MKNIYLVFFDARRGGGNVPGDDVVVDILA